VPPDGGVIGTGGLSLLLGRPFSLPEPSAGFIHPYHDDVAGMAPLPDPTQVAANAFVSLSTADHTGLWAAVGRAHPEGLLTFGLPGNYIEARLVFPDPPASPPGVGGAPAPTLYLLDAGGPRIIALHGTDQGFASPPEVLPIDRLPERLARVVPVPGSALPYLVWMSDLFADPSTYTVAVAANGRYVAHDVMLPDPHVEPAHVQVVDLDGDGLEELFLGTTDQRTSGLFAVFFTGRLDASSPQPQLTRAADLRLDDSSYAPFFGKAPPSSATPPADDRRDLFLAAIDSKNVILLRARPDGTFDTDNAERNPALFRPGPGEAPAPLAIEVDGYSTRDLDGDGVLDLLFETPGGAVVALADVERR
jgi:hypothetical protein